MPSPDHESLGPPRIDWASELARHERWLRTVIAARLGERQAIDDVWQELSLAVVRGRALPSDPAKVPPWLYRLAVLQSLLYRRRQGRARRLVERYADRASDRAPSGPGESLDWLLADERRQWVRAGLARLPGRDAEILLLKYREDWSYQQLAAQLGITVSAVETRLHRARGRLRKLLSNSAAGVTSHEHA